MSKKIYVVTSGRRINLIMHEQFSTMTHAINQAKLLKRKGKKYDAIKSYKEGETLSHEKYV